MPLGRPQVWRLKPVGKRHHFNIVMLLQRARLQYIIYLKYCCKKRFYGEYLAKSMFLKRCRIKKLERFPKFFKQAGCLYDLSVLLKTQNNDMKTTLSCCTFLT